MGERDWSTELSSALDEADAAAPGRESSAGERGLTVVPAPGAPPAEAPPVDEELDLMGPGRSLEGWAEELASAFAEDDAVDEPAPEPPERETLLGTVLRFDSLGVTRSPNAPDEAAVTAAVDVAVAVAAADLAADVAARAEATDQRLDATESRLQRIESLLTADLAQLGPAVLSDSVAELETRLTDLDAALRRLAERLEAVQAPTLPELPEPPEVPDVLEPLGELRGVVDRLSDRVAAQARFLAAHADSVSAQAHQRDDLLRAILARLDAPR